jgi:hypothetical protein
VRIPIPPHPHEEPQAVKQAGGSSFSSGRPRARPLGSYGLETCLTAGLEHDDLCRALRLLGASCHPDQVEVHLLSFL